MQKRRCRTPAINKYIELFENLFYERFNSDSLERAEEKTMDVWQRDVISIRD